MTLFKPKAVPLIIVVFVLYWSSTIVVSIYHSVRHFNPPTNINKIEQIVYQKWGFFTPPAHYNFKLYFIIYDNNYNKIDSIEVLTPLFTEKQTKAPFNQHADLLLQILYADIQQIKNRVEFEKAAYKKKWPAVAENTIQIEVNKYILNKALCQKNLHTLFNYANYLIEKNTLKKNSFLKIRIASIEIVAIKNEIELKEKERHHLFFNTDFIRL
jgi:hypothetical protein